MTSNITWKEVVNGGTQIIKLDDRRSGGLFKQDEEVELDGRRFKVVGLESAVVLIEPLGPPLADPANPAIGKDGQPVESKAAIETRAAARRDNDGDDSAKLPAKAGPVTKPAPHPATMAASASKLADHKPAPHHVTQRRHTDPLRRAKVASHKKK